MFLTALEEQKKFLHGEKQSSIILSGKRLKKVENARGETDRTVALHKAEGAGW